MKKLYFYGMVIVCLFCTSSIFAQDRFWIRAAGNPGNWNDVANWSATSGGAGGASVPNGATFNAFFNQGATVNVNGSFPVNRVVVSGATLVRLLATSAASTVTVGSTSVTPGSEAFRIETGATLEVGCTAAFPFDFTFANNTRGVVNGIWDFTGTSGVNPPNGATFVIPTITGFTNQLDIFGTVRFGNNTRNPSPLDGGPAYLFFRSGSTYHLNRNGGASPPANWDANSTILVTGIVDLVPTFNPGSTPELGHMTFNCPGITAPDGSIELSLNGLILQGNLTVQNTNSLPLTVLSGITATPAATIEGNFNISGTSVVYIGEDNDRSYDLSVGGNLNLSGGSFLMQLANGVGTNTTVLSLQGNLNHTGGTFGVTSNTQSTTTDLFVVEMNGTGAQTISSTGIIDNANNMLTLRLNKTAGTSLSTPVSFGKISWNSTNKGILTTTTTNVLTVRNPDATNATVINLPANNGYVSGPVRRLTNSTGTYQFPTGKSGFLRYADVIPATTAASTYTAEYFRTAYTDLTVINPLTAVSNVEYWEISRLSGSAAQIRLNIAAAVPGAGPGDGVVVARFNGADWVSVKGVAGTAVTPGNSGSGFALSDELPAFSPFTLAYGPAGALPIDLVSFTAKKLNNTAALLNWEVTASSTPDRFEVLRSTDGNNFTNIGTVQGVDQKLKYDFTDNNLPSGTTYYRLRMIDKDGDVKLSGVVAVTNGTDGLFLAQMAPTVVIDRARITVTSPTRGNLQMVVTDMQGRIVKQQINGIDVGSQPIWLNLQSLASGAYQLTGYLDGKRSASIRFIKQ
jgi:hypothetical protein